MRRRNAASITTMSRLTMPLFLRESDVKALLTMEGTLAALEAAFGEWAAGRASNQPRRRVAGGAVLATMSAALPAKGLMGFKAYTHSKAGARVWVCLFRAADGRPPRRDRVGGAPHLCRRVGAGRPAPERVRLQLSRSPRTRRPCRWPSRRGGGR